MSREQPHMSEITLDTDRTLGDLVRETPAYASVFESYDIDYCCGGDKSLAAACTERDISIETICKELEKATENPGTGSDWETLDELVDHIVETHHEYLREELPELRELVETISRVHGENHPELHEIEEIFSELAEDMRTHITEEETDGFPVIRELARGESLTDPEVETLRAEIESFEANHEETADRLERIATLTNGYDVPDDACPTYEATLSRLERLEADTHMHVHRENNVLFAKAQAQLEAEV
jgi:regulator of cell morphogenesis and NO signaling